jgi:DNA-binding transcriptional ArsR family regulator
MAQTQAATSPGDYTESVESLLSDEGDLYMASRALKAMGHPLRLKILCILAGMKETSVQDLVDLVGTSQSNISQHLSILRDKGILASRKDANKVYYRIGDEKILALMGTMKDTFCASQV